MKKSEWNEERLKALLSQLPTVKDNRSANQIYQKLILAPKRKSPKKRVGAFVATVLVLFLLMLITPQLIEQIRSQNSADANISSDGKLVQTEADVAKSEPANTFVVSQNQKDDYITFAFLDESKSVVVPVSLEKSTGMTNLEDALHAYSRLGVDQFTSFDTAYLDKVKFKEQKNNKKLKIQVDEKIPELSVEDFERLKNVINETFKWGSYDSVLFISNDKSGVEFETFGMLADMAIMHQTQKCYYLYESSDGRRFLAPSSESYESVQEAIKMMKNEESGTHLKPILSDDTPIEDIQKNGKELIIQFSSSANIENKPEDVLMVEGLLLTAKDFGFTKVKFKNASITKVGAYDLSKSVQVPYAPNPMTIEN